MPPEKQRPLARGDACQTCKGRKIRCPGERPTCSRCLRLGKSCTYVDSASGHTSPTASPLTASSLSNVHYDAYVGVGQPLDGQTLQSGDESFLTSALPTPSPQVDSFLNLFSANASSSQPRQSHHGSTTTSTTAATLVWPQTQGFGILPTSVDATDPIPPTDFEWDWSSIDLQQLLGLPGGEGSDLSEADRDHLLLLYFSYFHLFNMQVHLSSLYAKIHATDPEERPHPCLLYAIFLVSSRLSNLPHLREKEDEFYRRARSEMDKAVAKAMIGPQWHLMFDAVRAGTLIAIFLYSKDSFVEGWVMTGQAIRLAIACGLDRIPSSTYFADGGTGKKHSLNTNDESWLGMPTSRIALVDRCAATALHWTAGFEVEAVTTPLPRAWTEYESDMSHGADCDETLLGLMNGAPVKGCMHQTHHSRLIKAVVLMHAAVTKRPGNERTQAALDRFVGDMGMQDEGKNLSADSRSLEFIVLGTELYLKGANMYTMPTKEILEVIQRMMGVLRSLRQQVHYIGDHSIFISTIWSKIARLLAMETKRLEYLGDTAAAAALNVDVQLIVSCLRPSLQGITQNAVKQIDSWTDMTPTEFFEKEEIEMHFT